MQLLAAVQKLLIPFIADADAENVRKSSSARLLGSKHQIPILVESLGPKEVTERLDLDLGEHGKGKDGLIMVLERILKLSVNTWDQGFMDKLYASTNAIGVASELILAVLNTNVSLFLSVEASPDPCRAAWIGRSPTKACN